MCISNVPRKVCVPEPLDVEESMQAMGIHEDSLNTAANLGLMDDSGEQKLLFMRLHAVEKTVDLKALPEGYIGKLLVYKSGAVKMKLGEVLYDVSPGSKSGFAEDVVVVNTEQKTCRLVGDVYRHMQI